jgi:hypothetical protein
MPPRDRADLQHGVAPMTVESRSAAADHVRETFVDAGVPVSTAKRSRK